MDDQELSKAKVRVLFGKELEGEAGKEAGKFFDKYGNRLEVELGEVRKFCERYEVAVRVEGEVKGRLNEGGEFEPQGPVLSGAALKAHREQTDLTEANVKQAHNAVQRAVDLALDETKVFGKRLDALETALERSFDAGQILDSEAKGMKPEGVKDWRDALEGEGIRMEKALEGLKKELGEVSYTPQEQAHAMARLAAAEARIERQHGTKLVKEGPEIAVEINIKAEPLKETNEARARREYREAAQKFDDNVKSAQAHGAFVAVRAEQLTAASGHFQKMEKAIKALAADGVSQSVLIQFRRIQATQQERFAMEVKALSQEVKKPGALDGMTKEAGASLTKSVQNLAKGLEVGRGR